MLIVIPICLLTKWLLCFRNGCPSVLANMLYVGTAGADLRGGGAPDARPPVKIAELTFFFKYVAQLEHLLYKFSFFSRGTSPRMSIYHIGSIE